MKAKFDMKALPKLFLENVEKLIFVLVVLGFLFFIWKSIGREKYTGEPEELTQAVSRAKQTIKDASTDVDGKVENVKERIEEISDPLEVKPYEMVTQFERPVFKPLSGRSEPTLVNIEKIVGKPGRGLLANSGSSSGQRWVLLTGLVNDEKMQKAYKECFREAAHRLPTDNIPEYVDFEVQRAEIVDESQDISKLEWQKPYQDIEAEYSRFASGSMGNAIDVNESQKNDFITFPLPSRQNRPWGPEVGHMPELPVQMPMHREIQAKSSGDQMGRSTGRGRRHLDSTNRNDANSNVNQQSRIAKKEKKISPYLLFRFLDYNVEPGKRYRYRVRLYLKNPNWQVAEQFLSKDVRDRMQDKDNWKSFIVSGWSKPSEVVRMTLDDRILAKEVISLSRPDAEPSGTVVAIHWDKATGTEIFDEFSVSPGMLVNLFGKKAPASSASPGASIDYKTEMCVLDMIGGEKLPGRNRDLTRPGEMLLMDSNGALIVRNDQQDDLEYRKLKQPRQGPRMGGRRPGGNRPIRPRNTNNQDFP
jgi:hypothetical protein